MRRAISPHCPIYLLSVRRIYLPIYWWPCYSLEVTRGSSVCYTQTNKTQLHPKEIIVELSINYKITLKLNLFFSFLTCLFLIFTRFLLAFFLLALENQGYGDLKINRNFEFNNFVFKWYRYLCFSMILNLLFSSLSRIFFLFHLACKNVK